MQQSQTGIASLLLQSSKMNTSSFDCILITQAKLASKFFRPEANLCVVEAHDDVRCSVMGMLQ